MQAAHPSNPVSLLSLITAALLHILHLCCPAELFTCSVEITWLWPTGSFASLASPEFWKGYVCLKVCVGRWKEGRLAGCFYCGSRAVSMLGQIWKTVPVLNVFLIEGLLWVTPGWMSLVHRCDSVQLLLDRKNVTYTVVFNPSGERLGMLNASYLSYS